MAIINPASGVNPKKVIDGVMFTTSSTGSVQAVTSTTNRIHGAKTGWYKGSANQSQFSALDNLVTSLDAAFDALPDKSPWVTYAANIAGDWDLCANCQPDDGAKKLYRQYNFNRTLLGLTNTAAPVDNSEFYSDALNAVTLFTGGGFDVVIWRTNQDPQEVGTVFASVGHSLSNPSVTIPGDPANMLYFPGDPQYIWSYAVAAALGYAGQQVPEGTQFPTCYTTPNGAPGTRYFTSIASVF